jgi:S-adenosylmethionine:tRNA ribosyltransferase-isomerase
MTLKDFDYYLPRRLIAQHPLPERGLSRLLVLKRQTATWEHRGFQDLPQYLGSGDVLVVNDTKVRPARLLGEKKTGGRVEILLVQRRGNPASRLPTQEWDCLVKGLGRLRDSVPVFFAEGLQGEITSRQANGLWVLRFPDLEGTEEVLRRIGFAPLPPYIRRNGDRKMRGVDLERYQTIFACKEGAIAAPTAGLHFEAGLLDKIQAQGTAVVPLTLHVGLGTFLPVKTEDPRKHRLKQEFFALAAETAAAINQARRAGGQVFAVGTTVTRALETCADERGRVRAQSGETELFILPGHRFRTVDHLITNFHLPRSTLLMLVSAFAGRELILAAYEEAVKENYRFYSYGDAMLIL